MPGLSLFGSVACLPDSTTKGTDVKVIVFGGTSWLGRQVWRKALDDGHQVTVFGRWAKELVKKEPALRAIRGDSFDAGAMSSAISRNDAVVVCLGTDYTEHATPTTATRIIVDAMVNRDVKRLVVATTTEDGLDETKISMRARIFFPFVRLWSTRWGTHMLGGHEPQEKIVKESPLDWTIVRVPVINDKLAPGFTERTTNVSREDAGTYIAKQLDDPTNIHRTVTARDSQGRPPSYGSDAAPPSDAASAETPAKRKFDDYPLDINE